jgi:hypothetical protein
MSTSSQPGIWKAAAGKLALVVAAVWIASFPAAEAVFRLLGERTTTNLANLYQPFGAGGYRLRAGAAETADTIQGRYSVVTNDLGLRCGTATPRTSPGPRRVDIVALGDSQAFGNGLPFEDSLVGQLAARAEASGLHLENAAVGGHYLANQFELLRWLDTQGIRPRRILLFLSPYLIATAGKYNYASVGSDGRLYARGKKPGITVWLKQNTVTYGRLRNTINRFHPLTTDELVPLAVKIFLKQLEGPYRDNTLAALTELSQWAGERRAELTIVYTPMAVEVAFDAVRKAAQPGGGEVDADVPLRSARAATAALGLDLYDLRAPLAQLSAQRTVLTLPSDPHYGARTSAMCAQSLWDALNSRDRFSPAALARAGDGAAGARQ